MVGGGGGGGGKKKRGREKRGIWGGWGVGGGGCVGGGGGGLWLYERLSAVCRCARRRRALKFRFAALSPPGQLVVIYSTSTLAYFILYLLITICYFLSFLIIVIICNKKNYDNASKKNYV